jgi:hypothetical protein
MHNLKVKAFLTNGVQESKLSAPQRYIRNKEVMRGLEKRIGNFLGVGTLNGLAALME